MPDGEIDDVDIVFKKFVNGDETYELTADVLSGGNETISQRYDEITQADGLDEYPNGAYAFVGAFINQSGGSADFDLTFFGPGDFQGPKFACVGFEPPLDDPVVIRRPNRVLPLRIVLLDEPGFEVDDLALQPLPAPVVQLTFLGEVNNAPDTETLDSAGRGDDGNTFQFKGSKWAFNLKTKGLSEGAYKVEAVSGDPTQYRLDPKCSQTFEIQ